MKLYAVAMQAKKFNQYQVDISFTSAYVLAQSDKEAIGSALHNCKLTFPPRDGWQDHDVNTFRIPRNVIELATE